LSRGAHHARASCEEGAGELGKQNYFKDYKRLGPFAKLATTYKAKPAAKR
jgi:hypothetical protein